MRRALLGIAALMPFGIASAASIVIVNQDGAGEGFNDPTPVSPVGGNPGTTLGEQRMILFETAAKTWGALLKSNLVIRVGAQFDPQLCTTSSAVLGSAGPTNFLTLVPLPPGAKSNTFYPQALAESLLKTDKNAGQPDIDATFNSAIDTGCFGPNKLFWYGINPNVAVPGNRVALFPTVLHELGHGLGFISLVCDDVGGCGGTWPYGGYPSGLLDIWAYYQADAATPASTWNLLTNAQRGTSLKSDNLVWVGANVTADLPTFAPTNAGVTNGHMELYAPATIEPGSSVSHWTKLASNPNLLMEPVLSTGLFKQVDLTYSLYRDIGWGTFPRDEIFPDNFDAN